MHTYRTSSNREGKFGFQVGTEGGAGGQTFNAIGPHVEDEGEAAALCSYLNGGAYKPETASELFKPAAEARDKANKELEAQAKREADAEKARIERERKAALPPEPEPSDKKANKSEEAEHPRARDRAHAASAKQHVKRQRPSKPVSIRRKHK